MQKYKESIDIESGSLEEGGAGITRVIENKDPNAKDSDAPAPVFDESRTKSSIPPVRTLQSDLESVVKNDGASLSKTFVEKHDAPANVPVKPGTKQANTQSFGGKHDAPAAKAKKKPAAPAKEPQNGGNGTQNTAIAVLSVLLLLGAGYLSLPLFGVEIPSLLSVRGNGGVNQVDDRGNNIDLPKPPLRNVTETSTVSLGGKSRIDILSQIDATRTDEANGLGATVVFFTVDTPILDGSESSARVASIEEFFSATEISAGPILPRSIESYTFGILPNGNTFLVAKVRSFEEALGALYTWEEDMASDLRGVLQFNMETTRGDAEFEDALVENQNVRVLYNTEGAEDVPTPSAESVLAYSFPTTDTLVITSSLEAMKSVYDILQTE